LGIPNTTQVASFWAMVRAPNLHPVLPHPDAEQRVQSVGEGSREFLRHVLKHDDQPRDFLARDHRVCSDTDNFDIQIF
jgi:hypothetical protein